MNSRDEILALLRGQYIPRLPVFGVLPNLTASGLQAVGAKYSETHVDALKMADAAQSTYDLFGIESAVVPFDLCVEAEALGARVDFHHNLDAFVQPVVSGPLDLDEYHVEYGDLENAGRIPLVGEAIRILKARVGRDIVIGASIAGPFTLCWQMFGAEKWLGSLAKIDKIEFELTDRGNFLNLVARYYLDAGADFITVHEMGGSPQVIGAERFRQLVKPALQRLFDAIPSPRILSICGNTNAIVLDLAGCGADAIHIDQDNDLALTRRLLPDAILLGNLDPVEEIAHGTPESIAASVRRVADAGASAICPGCDLYIETPDVNMRALVSAARGIVTTKVHDAVNTISSASLSHGGRNDSR